ncbi:MAG: lysoplasmalogenase [Christensenellaceae bacterium]|jgi:uncharacterized membrane protein YhhN|nr:lysoplasmalogenase [Christensenellaceae bacterium]
MLVYIFASLTVAIILFKIVCSRKSSQSSGFVFKCISSLFFCLTGIIAVFTREFDNNTLPALILTALMIAMAGDIILTLPFYCKEEYSNLFSAIGGVAFFTGHILYITAFFINTNFNIYLIPIALIPVLIYCFMIKFKIMSPGKNAPFILGYSIVLGILLLSVSQNLQDHSIFSYIILPAALLFILSDTSLFLYNYGNPKLKSSFTANYLILLPYYIAQVLFAVSISFV